MGRNVGRVTYLLSGLTVGPRPLSAGVALIATLLVGGGATLAASPDSPRTKRVSVGPHGVQGKRPSQGPRLSGNGRFAVFDSTSSNLVRHDTNGRSDVFVRDLKTGRTRRVSVSSTGAQGNGDSWFASISSNGRYVAFSSRASNLARRRDGNGHTSDVFVCDRKLHRTIRVSVDSRGRQGRRASREAAISANGHSVAFLSKSKLTANDAHTSKDIYVRDLTRRTTELVSVGLAGASVNGSSFQPSIDGNGRRVAFTSRASNLVPHDGIREDVFVRDRDTHETSKVDVSSAGERANSEAGFATISADGRFVAFSSDATNLAAGDTTPAEDVFVRDLENRTTQRVSVSTSGGEANDSSTATGYGLSRHGRFVAFGSFASNLVEDDTNRRPDAFVRDVARGTTRRVSVGNAGQQGNAESFARGISLDGRFVGFDTRASNLVGGDTNRKADAFVRGPLRP